MEVFKLSEEFFSKSDAFIDDNEIKDWLKGDIRKLSNELAKFERIKNFIIKRTPFSIEGGELTPSMKAKRKVVETMYADEIEKMYLQDESPSDKACKYE
jgi:long-chain acyl-CoA synthetase